MVAFANGHGVWDNERIEKLVRRLVARKLPLFAAFPDIGDDDLANEALLEIHKYKHRFDPGRAQFSTFIYMIGWRVIRGIWMKRSKEAAREVSTAVASHTDAVELVEDEPTLDPDEPLGDWLRRIYVVAWRAFDAPKFRQGRRTYNAGQAVACVLLMHRKKLSCRGAAQFFAQHPELARSIGFDRVPHYSWFNRAADVATLNKRGIETLLSNNSVEVTTCS